MKGASEPHVSHFVAPVLLPCGARTWRVSRHQVFFILCKWHLRLSFDYRLWKLNIIHSISVFASQCTVFYWILLGCVAMSDDAWSLRFGNADHCEIWQIDTNWHRSHRSIWFERIENRLFPDLRNLRRKSQKQHFRSPVPPSPPLPTTTTTTITNQEVLLRQLATLAGLSGAGAAALFLSLVQSTALKFSGPPLAMFHAKIEKSA